MSAAARIYLRTPSRPSLSGPSFLLMLVGALTHVKACRGNLGTHPAAARNSSSRPSLIGGPRGSPTPAHAVWQVSRPTPVPGQNNLRLSLAALKSAATPMYISILGASTRGRAVPCALAVRARGVDSLESTAYTLYQTHRTHGPVHPLRPPARRRRQRHNAQGSTTPSNP